MLNKKIALLGAAVAALASTGANAATVPAQAEVEIVAAVTLTEDVPLDLGIVASSTTAGTVNLPSGSDTKTCTGGTICVGGAQRGQFTVSNATLNYSVLITVPPSTTLDDPGPGTAMTLALAPSSTGFTSAGADFVFHVGGTLSVGANQIAGTYVGTYNVSADYQ